jgi:hypothetical protein
MRVLVRLFVGVVPLLLAVLFAWLVMEGHLNLGGGEKDIFLAVPLLIWALVYLCSYFVLWWRGFAIGRSVWVSSGLASGLVAVAWLLLFGASWLKFR